MTDGHDTHGDAHTSWEQRYAESERIWSGRVNARLAEVADGLAPGRALDLGAGEGADAIWLARAGWRVVAVDISETALARGAEESFGLPSPERVAHLFRAAHGDYRGDAAPPGAQTAGCVVVQRVRAKPAAACPVAGSPWPGQYRQDDRPEGGAAWPGHHTGGAPVAAGGQNWNGALVGVGSHRAGGPLLGVGHTPAIGCSFLSVCGARSPREKNNRRCHRPRSPLMLAQRGGVGERLCRLAQLRVHLGTGAARAGHDGARVLPRVVDNAVLDVFPQRGLPRSDRLGLCGQQAEQLGAQRARPHQRHACVRRALATQLIEVARACQALAEYEVDENELPKSTREEMKAGREAVNRKD